MKRAFLAALTCAFLAVPVLADFQVGETGVSPGLSMTISSSGYSGGVLAGVYQLTIDGSGSLDGTGVEAFCIDIWDLAPDLSDNAMYEAVSLSNAPDPGAGSVDGMGETKARQLAQLLDAWWGASLKASTANVQAAALQLAVWEIVDELGIDSDGYNVTSGQFSASGNAEAVALANTMLGSVDDFGADYDSYLALTNDTLHCVSPTGEYAGLGYYQDYVVKVPVPAALVLGLLGMGVAGVRLRKHA